MKREKMKRNKNEKKRDERSTFFVGITFLIFFEIFSFFF